MGRELLQAVAQVLLRGGSALEDPVPLHRRPGRGRPASPQPALRLGPFLLAIAPFRKDLVVAVECVYSWYWLADLCAREGIAFVLGHALYMKAIHGAKAKSDRIDSERIAVLVRGGLMPVAYAYPADMRATLDLMRRRLLFVRQRGSLLAHIQITHHQYNVAPPGTRITYRRTVRASAKASRTRACGTASPPSS